MKNILLLTYANDGGRTLPFLEEEFTEVCKNLEPGVESGYYDVISIAKQEELNKRILENEDRLRVFMYSGHADENNLHTEGGKTYVKGLAGALGKCKNLKAVVLNGCYTKGLIHSLHQAGVPLVIATTRKVRDSAASRFAKQFFNALSLGKSLEKAFDAGINAAETAPPKQNGERDSGTIKVCRGVSFGDAEEEDAAFLVYIISTHPTEKAKAAQSLEWQLVPPWSQSMAPIPTSHPLVFQSRFLLIRLFWRLQPWLDFRKGYWAVLKNGAREITTGELKQTFKQYIEPSQFKFADIKAFVLSIGAKDVHKLLEKWKQNLLSLFQDGFLQAEKGNYVLLLSDSGIGKTTFLQRLFYKHASRYPRENLAFVYAGKHTALQLDRIHNKENTILFLDGLDEDFAARNDLTAALLRLSATLLAFKKVFVTARIQLFLNREQEWRNLLSSQDRNPALYNVIMFQFTREEAQRYLESKFNEQVDQKAQALDILELNSDFFCRPLLLVWIDHLLYREEKKFAYLYQVYETLVTEWCKREAAVPHAERSTTQGGNLQEIEDLIEFSKAGAAQLFRTNKENFTIDEIAHITRQGAALKFRDAHGRSFLKRNPDNDAFAFTHQSFFSYFLALSLLEGRITEEEFDFDPYPEAADFYEDMCWNKFLGMEEKPIGSEGHPIRLADDSDMQAYFAQKGWRSDLMLLFPNRAMRALCIRCGDSFQKFNNRPHIYGLTRWLKTHCPEIKPKPYVFYYYELVTNEQLEQSYDASPALLQRMYSEYVFDKVLDTFLKPTKYLGFQLEAETNAYLNALPPGYPIKDFGKTFQAAFKSRLLFQAFAKLEAFSASGLCITDIGFLANLQNLIQISLSNNLLGHVEEALVPIKDLQHLKTLDLNNNKLNGTHITVLETFKNLEELNLSNNIVGKDTNPLSSISVLSNLHVLDLSNNQLGNSEDNLNPLIKLSKLKILDLSNNNLNESHISCLYALKNLEEMRLGQNLIQGDKITLTLILEMPELSRLTIYDNPLCKKVLACKELSNGKMCLRRLREHFLSPPEMIEVSGGEFETLSGQSELPPAYNVNVNTFYMSKYLVTVGEFRQFVEESSYQKDDQWHLPVNKHEQHNDRYPVTFISFYDAIAYCNWMSQKWNLEPCYLIKQKGGSLDIIKLENANGYRIPSNLEWEYAVRGGLIGLKHNYLYAGGNKIEEVGWFEGNSGNTRHPVGQLKPNQLGLYDMSGNVYEWCWEDFNNFKFHGIPTFAMLRGGSWFSSAQLCRIALPFWFNRFDWNNYFGFRLTR